VLVSLDENIRDDFRHVLRDRHVQIIIIRPGVANPNGPVALNTDVGLSLRWRINSLQLGEEPFQQWLSRFWYFML
jgi:hypothetical protein